MCRWAAIANYLPQRTDNDIKNYWNTHLKKKMSRLETSPDCYTDDQDEFITGSRSNITRGQWEKKLQTDIPMAKQALCAALSVDSPNSVSGFNQFTGKPRPHQASAAANYAWSAENISRLLQGWMEKPLKSVRKESQTATTDHHYFPGNFVVDGLSSSEDHETTVFSSCSHASQSKENTNNLNPVITSLFPDGNRMASFLCNDEVPTLQLFEKWLLDEGGLPFGDGFSLL